MDKKIRNSMLKGILAIWVLAIVGALLVTFIAFSVEHPFIGVPIGLTLFGAAVGVAIDDGDDDQSEDSI